MYPWRLCCPYHHAHDLQLLQDKVHLLLCGQRGQDGVVAPAGQLGVVVRVLCRDELQTGVSYQMPTFTAHVFWNGRNRWGVGILQMLQAIRLSVGLTGSCLFGLYTFIFYKSIKLSSPKQQWSVNFFACGLLKQSSADSPPLHFTLNLRRFKSSEEYTTFVSLH